MPSRWRTIASRYRPGNAGGTGGSGACIITYIVGGGGHKFDPRRPISPLGKRLLASSNALYDRVDYGSGGTFAEPGTTRHAVKP